MAENILFTVPEPPAGAQCQFTGRQEAHGNPNFDKKSYQVAFMLEDLTKTNVGPTGAIVGIQHFPMKLWKNLDIDTPFFKECVTRRLTIPEMIFHFFHNETGDTQPINFFTITLTGVSVIQSKIIHLDTSAPHLPSQLLTNPNVMRAYIEELELTARKVKWQYKRENAPRVGDKAAEFIIGD